jgi:hypothetical protein
LTAYRYEPESAGDFLLHGMRMRQGARALNASNPRLKGPFFVLIGYAIELALKAHLRHVGLEVSKLKGRKLGHKLEALLEYASHKGLSTIPEVREFIVTLGPLHEDHVFRYPPNKLYMIVLHEPPFALAATDSLLGAVADAIGLTLDGLITEDPQ